MSSDILPYERFTHLVAVVEKRLAGKVDGVIGIACRYSQARES